MAIPAAIEWPAPNPHIPHWLWSVAKVLGASAVRFRDCCVRSRNRPPLREPTAVVSRFEMWCRIIALDASPIFSAEDRAVLDDRSLLTPKSYAYRRYTQHA